MANKHPGLTESSDDDQYSNDDEKTRINHRCPHCPKTFKQPYTLTRHIESLHLGEKFECNICQKSFNRKDTMKRHQNTHNNATPQSNDQQSADIPHHVPPTNSKFQCHICLNNFSRREHLRRHHKNIHGAGPPNKRARTTDNEQQPQTPPPLPPDPHCDESKSAFQGCGIQKTWWTDETDPILFLNNMEDFIRRSILHYFAKNGPQKWFMVVKVIFAKPEGDERRVHYLHGKSRIFLREEDYVENYSDTKSTILKGIDEFQNERGSGFVLQSIESASLTIAKYKPIRGGCFIPLPSKVKQKQNAMGNVRNTDDRCIAYAIAKKRHYCAFVENQPHEMQYYEPYTHEVKLEGIPTPVSVGDMDKVERLNKLTINVYSVFTDKGWINPLRISKAEHEEVINLLLIIEEDVKSGKIKSHYSWIKDFDKLLQYDNKPKSFCYYCMWPFDKRFKGEEKMEEHMKVCRKNGGQRVVFPKKDQIEYNAYEKEEKAPFVIYGDFESLNLKLHGCKNEHQKTWKVTRQTASGYTFRIISDYFPCITRRYTGENAVEHFMKTINKEGMDLKTQMKKEQKEIVMSPLDIVKHDECKSCYLCNQRFLSCAKEDDLHHLNNITSYLKAIQLPTDRIPTKTVLRQYRRETLLKNHPDKAGPEGKEYTQIFIFEYKKLLSYLQDNSLGDDEEDEDDEWIEEELEAILSMGPKVRDHCHWTGKYRGAAHSGCNLRKRINKQIPVFFHNLSGNLRSLHYLSKYFSLRL